MQEGDEKSARIDKKKRPESLFFENYRFIIPIWGIAICGICDLGNKFTLRGLFDQCYQADGTRYIKITGYILSIYKVRQDTILTRCAPVVPPLRSRCAPVATPMKLIIDIKLSEKLSPVTIFRKIRYLTISWR